MFSDASIQFLENSSSIYTLLTFCNVHYAQVVGNILIMLKGHL